MRKESFEYAKRSVTVGEDVKMSSWGKLGAWGKWFKEYLPHTIGIIGFFTLWYSVTELKLVNTTLLPKPWSVLQTMISMISDGSLIKHTLASLQRVLIGFILAFLLALPFGLFMGMSVTFRKAFDPLVELLRPIPPIAIIPISILWFGIGETSKIFIITYASFFPIALNVMGGVHGVESLHLKAAQTLGANRLQTFYYVTLRSAIPNIVIGLRSGLSMAFISLVAAELIASDAGLGFLIQDARYVFRTDQMLVGMITIGVVGFIINKIVLELEKLVVRWK